MKINGLTNLIIRFPMYCHIVYCVLIVDTLETKDQNNVNKQTFSYLGSAHTDKVD